MTESGWTTELESGIDASPARGAAGWLREGARSAVLLEPDWRGLRASPGLVLALVALAFAIVVGLDRLAVEGAAAFYGRAAYAASLPAFVNALLCWRLAGETRSPGGERRRGGPELFAMLWAQAVVLDLVGGLALAALAHSGRASEDLPDQAGMLLTAWTALAQVRLLCSAAPPRPWQRFAVALVVAATFVAERAIQPGVFWYPRPSAEEQAGNLPLAVTQELIEAQPRLLASALDGIAPQRPGTVDLYAVTFAPYASQDVFLRESAMVADVMAQRFDAAGRVVQLVNNKATADELPWATPLNLQRAIAAAARRMDRGEDVLFLHLTSHGGADGKLAADFDPLSIDEVTPQQLKQWLDDAGVRWRVVSVSACFSGSWIAPLAGDGTLVMTAADESHTSYGCGSRSPLTFFGQAMYDEQLRHTRSFERAFAESRKIIDTRERAAGKADGYSNPQIREGEGIRRQLARLEAQLAARAELAAASAPR